MKGFIQEFKEFAVKGNVVDMAVGVIIGGAFGKIVSSLVADVIMPLVGVVVGGVDFKSLKLVLREAVEGQAEVALAYGNFLQAVVDFGIIAFSIFMALKVLLRVKNQPKPAPQAPPPPPEDIVLLREIRDALKK